MTMSEYLDPSHDDTCYLVRVSKVDIALLQNAIGMTVAQEVAKALAADFLATRGHEVLAAMSPEAIATMAIAEAGAAINETLRKKLPDEILEIERRGDPIVLQRGIFGGVTRLR